MQMKYLALLATLVFSVMFLSPNVVLSETVKWDDLVKRDGLHYKKFTDVPFTGKITGEWQGSFKNGKHEGPWVRYYDNGQLMSKGNFKNGKAEGPSVTYWDNGRLRSKINYNNDKEEGPWVEYYEDGTVAKNYTGTYKDGKKMSD